MKPKSKPTAEVGSRGEWAEEKVKHLILISIRHTFQLAAFLCLLNLLAGCSKISAKYNSTIYRVVDSETNRIAVQSYVESVVKEFGLHESLNESDAQMSYLSRYFLDGDYSLSASIHRERWQFSADDVTDFESFASRIKRPSDFDTVSQYLAAQLSPATKNLLSNYAGGSDLELQKALLKDINGFIGGAITSPKQGIIYEPTRFANVKLSPETLELLNRKRKVYCDVVQLNEMLLRDAYPREVGKTFKTNEIYILLHQNNWSGKKTAKYRQAENKLTTGFQDGFGSGVQIESRRGWIP